MLSTKIGDTPLKTMLGISDKQIAGLQKDLNGIKDFVYDTMKTVFMQLLGFSETDSVGILASLNNTFVDIFSVIETNFGKIKTVVGSFFTGFYETMKQQGLEEEQTGKKTSPFVKLFKGITGGLQMALETFKAEFSDSSETGSEMKGVLGEMRDTFNNFKDEILKVVSSFTGDLFGKQETGEKGMLDKLLNSDFIKNFGGEFIKTIGSFFSGIGSVFSFITSSATGGFNLAAAGEGIKMVMTNLVEGITGALGLWDATKVNQMIGVGQAATGLSKLGEAFKGFDTNSLQSLQGSLSGIIPQLTQLTGNIQPVNQTFIDSFSSLAKAIKELNEQLDVLQQNENKLKIMTNFTAEEETRVASIASSIKTYSDSVASLNQNAAQHQLMMQAINTLSQMAGQISIDSEKMGEVIGDKVAGAINRRLGS
jgi:hypothetical protein